VLCHHLSVIRQKSRFSDHSTSFRNVGFS